MIDGKTILAVIPARGGSKGVPRKNIRIVGGKPLIAWTIECAKKSQYIDRIIASSEDRDVCEAAKEYGADVPFIRPAELAQDDTPGVDPILHALKELPGFDYVVLLQPTSPLRTAEDIDGCLERCVLSDADFCVSLTEPKPSPYWMYKLCEDGVLSPLMECHQLFTRRQDLPKVYALNGAVYVADSMALLREKTFLTSSTLGYVMPKSRSLDIDTVEDFKYLEFLLSEENRD